MDFMYLHSFYQERINDLSREKEGLLKEINVLKAVVRVVFLRQAWLSMLSG